MRQIGENIMVLVPIVIGIRCWVLVGTSYYGIRNEKNLCCLCHLCENELSKIESR